MVEFPHKLSSMFKMGEVGGKKLQRRLVALLTGGLCRRKDDAEHKKPSALVMALHP